MAIEIVSLPINSMVDLSIAMLNYQRVINDNNIDNIDVL
jgi:hypothetical protein